MASIRTITSPGIQVNEIDRSQYANKVDYSIARSPNIFVCGFADSGENYSVQWINSQQTLNDTYGTPKNEPERYFYNACLEILNRSSTVLAAKLPYFNASKDRYTYTTFKIEDTLSSIDSNDTLSTLFDFDKSIKSFLTISSDPSSSGKISLSEFDKLITGEEQGKLNTIKVVNLKQNQYNSITANCIKTNVSALGLTDEKNNLSIEQDNIKFINTNDCLGYVPIIISPYQALHLQNILNNSDKISSLSNDFINLISTVTTIKVNDEKMDKADGLASDMFFYKSDDISVDEASLLSIFNNTDQCSFKFSTNEPEIEYTLSEELIRLFPNIDFINETTINRQYLKYIGVAIVQLYIDDANNSRISYNIVETFFGSLDKNAKDPITNESIFIDNIVNKNSQYINMFTNIQQSLIQKTDLVKVNTQTGVSLGFYKADCVKCILPQESILKPLNNILNSIQDINVVPINIIIDAGVSNIAQYLTNELNKLSSSDTLEDKYKKCLNVNLSYIDWKIDDIYKNSIWKTVIQKFDNFCKNIRKDCMFIADGPRPFCIEGQSKIIRKTKPSNTIQKSILPKLKYMNVINSSYTAGYCNWFLCIDNYSGNSYWCPPSIKTVGVYCTTDNYFHTWDAPAGLIRGKVTNDVYDIAFNPTDDDCGKIYSTCWNYALSFPMNGIIVEGQRTFQTNRTALDRVNVRRLMLYLERVVRQQAKFFVYEQNTPYTRQRFIDTLKPIFDNVVTGSGILQYVIVCDETNNTPTTIDNNELHCAIAVKPVKSIEFIVVNLIATNQSANIFEEVLR